MKWQKLGQIFEFDKSPFKDIFISHSQSPQAVVFDDFVRIYFSTRKSDKNGKFISHIQFVDMSKDFETILKTSEHEVIPMGDLGCFDEHGIFPINPIQVGEKIYAYTSGWTRRKAVSVDTGIGLAISEDNGFTFKKYGDGPILTASLFEPFLVVDGFVKIFNDIFHMWYIYGTDWKVFEEGHEADRTYVIGHATSFDGINWTKEGRQIVESSQNTECQALPTVIKIKNRYHMYFCFRNSYDFRKNSKNAYRLGYAYSDDLINWTRDDSKAGIDVSESGWDSEMMCYPNIFEIDNEIYLLYNGNEFGKYGFGVAKLEEV